MRRGTERSPQVTPWPSTQLSLTSVMVRKLGTLEGLEEEQGTGTGMAVQTRNREYRVTVGSPQDHKELQEAWALSSQKSE